MGKTRTPNQQPSQSTAKSEDPQQQTTTKGPAPTKINLTSTPPKKRDAKSKRKDAAATPHTKLTTKEKAIEKKRQDEEECGEEAYI